MAEMRALAQNIEFLRAKVYYHTQEMHQAAEAWKERREAIAEAAKVQRWDGQKERMTCKRDVALADASSGRSVHAELLAGYAAAFQTEVLYLQMKDEEYMRASHG